MSERELSRIPDGRHTHVDGLGLNDLIEIWADPQDMKNGAASHYYELRMGEEVVASIQFQHGPRNEAGSTPGVTENALLAVILDRLRCFNEGPYRCRENSVGITKVEEAMMWSTHRAMTRHRQGVLGKNKVHDDGTKRKPKLPPGRSVQ